MPPPSTMKAWVFKKSGLPSDVLHIESAWPVPIPGPGELLIKVEAAALNPVGWKMMSIFPITLAQVKPATPEFDLAGVVAGGELDGTGFSLGDEVFGIVPTELVTKSGRGTLAEFTVAPTKNLVKKPANISSAEAAAFPLTGLTAYVALKAGGLQRGAGQRVFINGGSSGTGTWGVQIAKEYGAEVVTTFSDDSESLVKSLNPTSSVNYRSVILPDYLTKEYADKPFDIIFDTAGVGALYHASPRFLKPDGIYVDIAGTASLKGFKDLVWAALGAINKLARPVWLGGTPRRYLFAQLQLNKATTDLRHADLQEAAQLLGSGAYRSIIDHEYKFEEVVEAYKRQMSSRAKGKVVVLMG